MLHAGRPRRPCYLIYKGICRKGVYVGSTLTCELALVRRWSKGSVTSLPVFDDLVSNLTPTNSSLRERETEDQGDFPHYPVTAKFKPDLRRTFSYQLCDILR